VHTEDFHNVVPKSKGCVTCQGYHPTEKPLLKTEWLIKQDEVVTRLINGIESDIDLLCDVLKPIKRSDAEKAFLQCEKAREEVKTALECGGE